jgi:hypothetical protein
LTNDQLVGTIRAADPMASGISAASQRDRRVRRLIRLPMRASSVAIAGMISGTGSCGPSATRRGTSQRIGRDRTGSPSRGASVTVAPMAEPSEPDVETREYLVDVLGEFVARAGTGPLLLPPVEPGKAAFPDPWAATRAGIALLLRRLAWHAGLDRAIKVEDRQVGARPTERKPATRVALVEVQRSAAVFALEFIGADDVAGTLAHEIGVSFAVLHRPDGVDPYRTAEAPVIVVDPDVDLERGSIAAVYLGLGVLAANAARQNHAVLEGQGFNPLLVAKVGVELEAGYLPSSSLTYLVAVQAALRGETTPPRGLVPAQRREVEAWLELLDRAALRARFGITGDLPVSKRPTPTAFPDTGLKPDAPRHKIAFRWRTNRGGLGLIAGTLLGIGAAIAAAPTLMPWLVIGGAVGGHLFGRQIRVPRCSACATTLTGLAQRCTACGAVMRGDIAHLSDRLAAEEQLQDTEDHAAS